MRFLDLAYVFEDPSQFTGGKISAHAKAGELFHLLNPGLLSETPHCAVIPSVGPNDAVVKRFPSRTTPTAGRLSLIRDANGFNAR